MMQAVLTAVTCGVGLALGATLYLPPRLLVNERGSLPVPAENEYAFRGRKPRAT
ncbi:hypothetical protein EV356DRAFT_504477 [Viridothelium virens]|uniref:Uncharacterized protein n=1 Tax=Viridothelium virens TaxID=1048519 RepID=A0A6A6H550_VIRVR|nr:hypothetical protein EV356DRAFT_504477 [Viridothelium virens]